jgi:signal peptidase I
VNETDPLALLRAARERAAAKADGTAAPPPPPAATVGADVPDELADPPTTPNEEPRPPMGALEVDGGDGAEPGVEPEEPGADRPRSALEGVAATGVRRRRRRQSATRNLVEWVIVLVGALVVALVVKTFLLQAFYIPSGSMEPTLRENDRVLVLKLGYDLEDVDRGDVIVFERPESWGPGDIEDLIKRVIGLPGDTVAVIDGAVFVNGTPLEEPWLPDGARTPPFFPESGCVPECTIPEGSVFVLGDNRSNSAASNQYGPVPFDHVVGRAFVRVWPVTDISGL